MSRALKKIQQRAQAIELVPIAASYLESAMEVAREVHAASVYRDLPLDEVKLVRQLAAAGLDHPERYFRLAVRGDVVLGGLYGCLQKAFFADELLAKDLGWWVRQSARGGPAASRLLLDFEKWAYLKGARKIALGQTGIADIERTRKLFEHCGYVVVGYNVMKDLE